MSATKMADLANQIQTFWSPIVSDQLKTDSLLPSLVNSDYQGDIKTAGDTVRVSVIRDATGDIRTVGTDADSFNTEKVRMVNVDVKANKVASVAFEIESLVDLETQLNQNTPALRESMRRGLQNKLTSYLFSLAAPTGSFARTGKANFNKAELLACRQLASQTKWPNENRFILLDPQYYNDILNEVTLTSRDYVGDQPVVIGGQQPLNRFGFNILEDNSLGAGVGYSFHKDFLVLVMQNTPEVKISDLHALKKRGYLISMDLVFGALLNVDGGSKVIKSTVA